MKLRQIFIYIWRINAIIILLGGILSTSLFGISALRFLMEITSTRQVSDVINVSNESGIKAKSEIGLFGKVTGSEILRAPLYLIQEYDYRAGSKESNSIQNYIFFDPIKKTSSWLKSKNEGLILSTIALPEIVDSNFEDKKLSTVGFIYLIVDQDTNGDKRINENDRKKLAISDPSGLRFKIIIDQVDKFNGSSIIKNNRISLLYLSANKLKVAEVDLRSQEIISNTEFNSQP